MTSLNRADLDRAELYLAAGSTAVEGFSVVVTPESAHWGFSGLRVLTLQPGETAEIESGVDELLVLPLTGGCRVSLGDKGFDLGGRSSVFDSVTDFAYVPRDSTVVVTSEGGGRFALPAARAERALPFRYAPASGVPVELRGAGSCSRQVNNFATPGAFETDKLIACEVITPAANWSSYPPHKHDESSDIESELEEIYYYEFRSAASGTAAPRGAGPGVGYQRVYGTAERPIEVLEEVHDGDVVLIPHGWHGPSIASPSHDMYYLNVMAGPEAERSWRICDDPDHGWIRGTWAEQPIDPRLPLYSAPSESASSESAFSEPAASESAFSEPASVPDTNTLETS